MSVLSHLQPEKVFFYFEEISKIPHGSRNTKAISDYLVSFAREHGLEVHQDEWNNVVMIQEATAGYETVEPIIIQGHMDMVCEKESGCEIDFEKDPLEIYVDGDFLRARGTTLGGDDGIAVAYALAVLDSPEISHPRLEVIITVDEEIGMLGAKDIDLSMLKGHRMLNIDSDIEGVFLTSCAGGMSILSKIPVKRITQTGRKLSLTVTGLFGGHSGGEIHKERANADILTGRLLNQILEKTPFGILSMAGGLKDNAIPRECTAKILVPEEMAETVADIAAELQNTLSREYEMADPDLQIICKDFGSAEESVTDYASTSKLVYFLRVIPNGVQNMSLAIPGLVETSLNLGIMELKENSFHTVNSIRSSVSSRKQDLCDRVCHIIEMLGGEAEIEGDYPAWEYVADSPLRQEITEVFRELFGKEPQFDAIHAGLECGILSDKIPNLDCVSFGPDNFDIHTPMERLSISSTQRVWDFLVKFLEDTNKSGKR